jgi:hypothetical protein
MLLTFDFYQPSSDENRESRFFKIAVFLLCQSHTAARVTISSTRALFQPNLLHNLNSILWLRDRMTSNSFILKQLVIIPALERLVAEKVNTSEPFAFQMLETISLVPACWKDIKADLTANGISQA